MSDARIQPPPHDGEFEVTGEFPLSTTQKRCWFLDCLNPGNRALNVALRWEVRGRVKPRSIERAFQTVIDRHEILRTRFVERDGAPVQQVVRHAPFKLGVFDLQNVKGDQREDVVLRIAKEQSTASFDLTRPELVRASFVQVEPQRAFLLLCMHQICFDGWSDGILGREIGEAAAAFDADRQPDFPELPLQYGDYALWQDECMRSDGLAAEETYWRETLAGYEYFEIPADLPRPAKRTPSAEFLVRDLPVELGNRMEAEAKRHGISTFSFGAAVLAVLLHRYTGRSDVTFGTQIAGRNEIDLEPLIGVFINNLVFRFGLEPDMTVGDHLGRVQKVIQDGLVNQALPFNRLVEVMNPPRDPSRAPLISVSFLLQKWYFEDRQYGDFELRSVPSRAPGSVYDMHFVMIGRRGGWRMTLEYNPDLYRRETVEEILDLWQATLEGMVAPGIERLSDLKVRRRAPQALAAAAEPPRDERALRTLEAHPAVEEAVIVGRASDPQAAGGYAFVVPSANYLAPLEQLPKDLRSYMIGLLPQPEMPSGISVLRQLPRDASGRVDESRLVPPKPEDAPIEAISPSAAGIPWIEAQIADIWSEVLGVGPIGRDKDFFELGGHSMLAVRVLASLRKRLQADIGLATVYQAPTIAALAERLKGRVVLPDGAAEPAVAAPKAEDDWRIVELRSEAKDDVPLIALNNAATLYALSKHLTKPRHCVCVRMFDPEKEVNLSNMSFGDIAAEYAKLVRAVRPQGPYALYGNCVHGNLAVEVARRLKAEDGSVVHVYVKDVWEPNYTRKVAETWHLALRSKWHDLKLRLFRVRRHELSVYDFLNTYRIMRTTGLLRLLVKLGLPEVGETLFRNQYRFVALLTEARNRHVPQPFDGDMTMAVTRDTPVGRGFDDSIGWRSIVRGKLRLERIPDIVIHDRTELGTAELAAMIERDLLGQGPAAGR